MATDKYIELTQKALNEKLKLTKKQEKEIKELYKELYLETSKKIESLDPSSLGYRYNTVMKKIFEEEIRKTNDKVKKKIVKNIEASAELANNIQIDFFNLIDTKFNLNMKNTFETMFGSVNKEAVDEIKFGKAYKDRKGLSERIWQDTRKKDKDIEDIVTKGLSNKTSARNLSKELLDYINPDINNPEYCSKRLARTVINHAFQLAQKRSCMKNPFVTGIQWNVGHHSRICPLCKERDGVVYEVKDVPLDHPNGVCFTTPVIQQSLEEVGQELREWVDGFPNSKLDEWFENNYRSNNVQNELAVTKLPGETFDDYRNKILNREYNLTINNGAQGKHIKSHNNYIEGRSYLIISMEEAQELVYKYAGTGQLNKVKGNWDDTETIITDKIIGYCKSIKDGQTIETNAFKIHYGNKGVHIVPTIKS